MISTRETSILSYNTNIAELESSISNLEEHRYLLSSSLNESSEFTDEILEVIEMMNNTMADLYISLVENSTLAEQLQVDLVAQQNLVTQWQQNAEDNRTNLSGVDLSGVELRGSDLSGIYWYDTICTCEFVKRPPVFCCCFLSTQFIGYVTNVSYSSYDSVVERKKKGTPKRLSLDAPRFRRLLSYVDFISY